MDSIGEMSNDIEPTRAPIRSKLKEFKLRLPSLNARLIQGGAPTPTATPTPRVLDFLKAQPSRSWFRKLRLSSPLAIFQRTPSKRERFSLSIPSPGIRRPFHIRFFRRINWRSIFDMCKEWLCHPMNIAFLFWLLCFAVTATFLGLLLFGILNRTIPSRPRREYWIENCNQVLNALFTLMSIYKHPTLFHHLFMLCRWNSEDVVELRKVYCKNEARRPHERAHMFFVVILLHVGCTAQYVLCGLYWVYNQTNRSAILKNFLFALGVVTPVIAGAYTVYSPLGREFYADSDEESQDEKQKFIMDQNLYDNRVVVSQPEWVGGLFDCQDDLTVGYLSFFCTFCVFGWNMERLGFGNMYVHMFTFLLLCIVPFWIFSTTALKIHNVAIDDVISITGVVLCFFGLLYGGFWRTQMRKRFNLPGNTYCFGSSSLSDYFQWMFCWSCSLAQEVRTANFYEVEDNSLYRKLCESDEESQPASEGASSYCAYEILMDVNEDEAALASINGGSDAMIPPAQPFIELDDGVSECDNAQVTNEKQAKENTS